MVAKGLGWNPGDRVITTLLEDHSNFVPWLHLREHGIACDILPVTPGYSLDLDRLEEAITDRTRLVAITQASGVLGTITPVQEISRLCRDHGALLLIDGTHSVPHMPVDVSSLGCDFLCFSGDRMLGPSGSGVLWMKNPVSRPPPRRRRDGRGGLAIWVTPWARDTSDTRREPRTSLQESASVLPWTT